MPVRLTSFPLLVAGSTRISFHDGYADLRHGTAHVAIDISAPEGTIVLATTAGLVLRSWMSGHGPVTGAGWSARGGNVVLIVDANGYAHYYAHMLTAPKVQPGQQVRAGASLGQVSNTGAIAHGSPIHLHYQVWSVGSRREEEMANATFTRRFGLSVNPYDELARLARQMGAHVNVTSRSVLFGSPRSPRH